MAESHGLPHRRPRKAAASLQGQRLVDPLRKSLEKLRDVGCERDRAGNRKLFYDQYVVLLLMYFFTPSLESLRALQQSTGWEKTRKKLGIERTALGSLSEAARVFDADHLRPIVRELAAKGIPLKTGREAEALRGLTAVDGSIFAGLSRMTWALWKDQDHRGIKLHLHFDVLKGVPADATVTPAACSESAALKDTLQPGRLYVLDRGYADYELFARIVAAKSSLIGRVKENIAYEVQEERPLTKASRDAGVIRDVVISRLGTSHHKNEFPGRPLRLVVVNAFLRGGNWSEVHLITDRLDLDADLVALAYLYRWSVELFFRWLKCVLGARHLIAHNQNGVTIQMYAALIVSLLIVLRTGRTPTKRTFEMIQFYLLGWVSEEEFDSHLASLTGSKKPS